jgi:hypothetical protein
MRGLMRNRLPLSPSWERVIGVLRTPFVLNIADAKHRLWRAAASEAGEGARVARGREEPLTRLVRR